MTTRIKLRRDTAANWTDANPILAAGEPGLEIDTGKVKYGDGVTAWNAIEHTGGDALTNDGAITVQTGDADRWLIRLRREDSDTQPSPGTGIVVYSTNYDSQGNAIVLAGVNLNDNTVAAFKFTAAGELVWKTIFDIEGNFYGLGHAAITATDDVVFCLGNESSNATVVKLNGATGAVIFSREVALGLYPSIKAIAVDNSGNIILAGDNENDDEDDRGLLVKLSGTAGTIVWQTILSVTNYSTLFRAVAVDVNNNIVVTGTTVVETPGGVNPTEEVIVVAKFSGTTGNIIWQKTVALGEVKFGVGVGLSLDSVGNIYVSGALYVANPEADTFGGGNNSNAAVVFKMTSQGAMVWDRRIGPGPCDWVGVSTAVGDDGDLYMYAATYQRRTNAEVNYNNGYYDQTLVLARYNRTTGAVVWQKYFDNPNAQEAPGYGEGPWGGTNNNTLDVFGDRILIGGSVRLGPSDIDVFGPGNETNRYFTQGFIAQFDTDATKFSVDGWTLETSRIPGKLNTGLVATTGPMTQETATVTIGTATTIATLSTGISVSRRTSKVNTWTFGKDGTFTAPADTNIKLQQTQLGYANMYGVWNNSSDDVYFDSVTHDPEGNAYVLGSNTFDDGFAHIYKFTPEGELVWQRQLRSGGGAEFNVSWTDDVYSTPAVSSGGSGYKVGDRIVLNGANFGSGAGGENSLTLSVATITNSEEGVGAVDSVTIESGVAYQTGSSTNVRDFYDNAECEVRSMTFDPVTGNPVVVISTPTYNGDNFDSEWTEAVVLQIDSGSGAVVKATTLSDDGDIYPEDVAVSVTGKVAVVGQKYGEYTEYGAITPLVGSAVAKLWVAKSDIDAEHYPGEPISNVSDWWITGSNITDQVQIQSVNNYVNLTGTTRQGSGATFDIIDNGNGTYSAGIVSSGTNYLAGHKIQISGSAIGGVDVTNDITITVDAVDAGAITGVSNSGTAAGTTSTTYNALTGTNYLVGSGAEFNYWFDPATTGTIYSSGIDNVGQNYVVGDVIVIPGTSFAGGTTSTNNITVTVTSVGGSGDLQNPVNFTGTPALTHLLLRTNDSVDFAAGGASFAIKQALGGETFIWTPDFSKTMGGSSSDTFYGVVWNAAGTSLYAVGEGRYETTYDQALVTKWSSTGTIQASVSVNANNSNNGADWGTVALMADDHIVTVHTMYNNVRDETTEVLVTKLDSNLQIIWQQFIGVWSQDDGWSSPNGQINVAVDPATDEILVAWEHEDDDFIGNDDAVYIVKLDTDGDVIWKRGFGVHESDTRTLDSAKFLSISGDKYTIVGTTDAPDNGVNNNAMIFTMPLDGTGLGYHGMWWYFEPNDDQIKVMRVDRESDAFTPNINNSVITADDNVKYYYTDYPDNEFTLFRQVIRSEVGGALEFADGSKQTFSTAIVPQVRISAGRYYIRPEDSGRHILVEEANYNIIIPNYREVTLPVGFTFTIVNISNSTVNVENQFVDGGERGQMWFSGADTQTPVVGINDNGSGQMVTLIKIKEGTTSDDGSNHGDIWMIAGADIYNND